MRDAAAGPRILPARFGRRPAASRLLLLAVTGAACSSAGGASGASGAGGLAGAAAAKGGSAGTLSAGGATGAAGSSGSAGAGGGFANLGVCGRRGKATADGTSFDGFEERYLVGEQGFGSDVCVVRFELKRVGEAPAGCSVCTWTHLVEYGAASVTTDTEGVCAKSDLGLDGAAITNVVGSRIGIGFAKQLGGAHGSARMTYNSTTASWDVTGNATWTETDKAFKFDYREGLCNYGP